jgi:hypothetical protein
VTPVRWVMLVLVLLVILFATLFTVQNSSRVTDLSLDLWFTAFHLSDSVPVPYLIWGAFGGGLLVGGSWSVFSRIGGGRTSSPSSDSRFPSTNSARVDDDWT